MIDIISAALSLFAIVVSIYAAFTANKSAAAAIRSSNCGVIFDDYLIKKIPQARTTLRFDDKGILCNGNNLCDALADMSMAALFYRYDDKIFFNKLVKECSSLEDLIVEAGNKPKRFEDNQHEFWQAVQKSLESIYRLIDKKRVGGKL